MLSVAETETVWRPLSENLVVPHDEAQYEKLVGWLDDLIDEVGEDEQHPLASLMEVLGILIQRYENENVPEQSDEEGFSDSNLFFPDKSSQNKRTKVKVRIDMGDHLRYQAFKIVLERIIELPAYKLRKDQEEIFLIREISELDKSINKNAYTREENSQKHSILSQYRQPNFIERKKITAAILPKRIKALFFIVAITLFSAYFLVRQGNPYLKLVGLIFVLTDVMVYLYLSFETQYWIDKVDGTFWSIKKRLIDVSKYIDEFGNISKIKLQRDSGFIAERLIEEEIYELDQNKTSRRIAYGFIAAISMTMITIYISGDIFLVYMKTILGYVGARKYVEDFNMVGVFFPLYLALFQYAISRGITRRLLILKKSLRLLRDKIRREEDEK